MIIYVVNFIRRANKKGKKGTGINDKDSFQRDTKVRPTSEEDNRKEQKKERKGKERKGVFVDSAVCTARLRIFLHDAAYSVSVRGI